VPGHHHTNDHVGAASRIANPLNPVNSNALTCGKFWAIKTLVTVLPFFLILIEVTENGLYVDRNHGIVFSPEVLAHVARLQISLSLDI